MLACVLQSNVGLIGPCLLLLVLLLWVCLMLRSTASLMNPWSVSFRPVHQTLPDLPRQMCLSATCACLCKPLKGAVLHRNLQRPRAALRGQGLLHSLHARPFSECRQSALALLCCMHEACSLRTQTYHQCWGCSGSPACQLQACLQRTKIPQGTSDSRTGT